MKKLLFVLIMALTFSGMTGYAKSGDIIGVAYNTDIVAYINKEISAVELASVFDNKRYKDYYDVKYNDKNKNNIDIYEKGDNTSLIKRVQENNQNFNKNVIK